MDENNFGVPAGWYPDPLGLPQLRWWDSQAWTEHTSEARAPIIIQPAATATRLGFADEELPSRREQRERERERQETSRGFAPIFADDFDVDYAATGMRPEDVLDLETETAPEREELSAQPLLAMTLKELEPPLTDTVDDATPGPRRASSHTNAAPVASTLSALVEEDAPEREAKAMKTYTAAVWAIALMPAIQVAIAIVLLVTGLGSNTPLIFLVVFAPYLIVLFFAAFDKLLLQVWGHKRPASPWWALLAEPGYLVVRAVRTYRETGKGFAPLAVFAGAFTSVLAAVLVLPGLVIAVFPGAFAAEAATAVESDALGLLGAQIEVTCPMPPMLIGDSFTCQRVSSDGTTDSVAVELTRQNGWIAWQVTDWGTTVLN